MESSRVFILGVLILSLAGLLINVNIGLVTLTAGSVLALLTLTLKSSNHSKVPFWFIWSAHFLALVGIYMATYGVANIVGSGRRYSARGAVSTLRMIWWAERQCVRHTARACPLSELNGQTAVEGFTPTLQRPQWRSLAQGPYGELAPVGQYYYALYPLSSQDDESNSTNAPISTKRRSPSRWIAYAWPRADKTLQSYCIDDHEEILELPISDGESAYLGLERAPKPQACLGSLHSNPEPPLTLAQREAIAQKRKPPPSTHRGQDGEEWRRWRGKRTRFARSRDPHSSQSRSQR